MAMVSIPSLVLLLAAATSAVAAESTGNCTSPGTRRPWHTLSDEDKDRYIDAELCLVKLPATLGLPGARSKFDDFQAIHQQQSFAIHEVGAFLPWHRLFVHAHETALRDLCDYTGHHPYWWEPRDAGDFTTSDIFDPVHGFGGDGIDPPFNGCIKNGPFANYTLALGPSYNISDNCIERWIGNVNNQPSNQENVDICLGKETFEAAWKCMEREIHWGGHQGVGSLMTDPVASPGDPLFYLHHTFIDKVYWDWQMRDRANRTKTVGGSNVITIPTHQYLPAHIIKSTTAYGDPGNVTTVNHVLNMFGHGPNRTIAEVLDIQGDLSCYEYADPSVGEWWKRHFSLTSLFEVPEFYLKL